MANSLCVHAHAKINLYLDVIGKRPDGYHELETIFHSIQLHDDVIIRKCQGEKITVHCDHPKVPCDEQNLAHRAAKLMIEKMEDIRGVELVIRKRIPVAAGLGGGSADAAAVLWGMNQLFELNLTQADLMRLGVQLGADVPFCLLGGAALGRGIGEILTPLPPIETPLVLANPGFEISTAWVFQNHNFLLTMPTENVRILVRCLQNGDVLSLADKLHNSLEEPVFLRYPAVAALKAKLAQFDENKGVLMSGSGATVFALMQDSTESHRLAKQIESEVAFCTVTTMSKVGLCIA